VGLSLARAMQSWPGPASPKPLQHRVPLSPLALSRPDSAFFCLSRPQVPDHVESGDGLAKMALGVFGDVNDEPDGRGRQPASADFPHLIERLDSDPSHLPLQPVHSDKELPQEFGHRRARLGFAFHVAQLGGGQGQTLQIAAQALDRAADVADVEPGGGEPERLEPQILVGQPLEGGLEFLARLLERIEKIGNAWAYAWNRPTEPRFRLCHAGNDPRQAV
jgi:hypothetical protein